MDCPDATGTLNLHYLYDSTSGVLLQAQGDCYSISGDEGPYDSYYGEKFYICRAREGFDYSRNEGGSVEFYSIMWEEPKWGALRVKGKETIPLLVYGGLGGYWNTPSVIVEKVDWRIDKNSGRWFASSWKKYFNYSKYTSTGGDNAYNTAWSGFNYWKNSDWINSGFAKNYPNNNVSKEIASKEGWTDEKCLNFHALYFILL